MLFHFPTRQTEAQGHGAGRGEVFPFPAFRPLVLPFFCSVIRVLGLLIEAKELQKAPLLEIYYQRE